MTTVRIDDVTFAACQQEAERRGITVSGFIRQAVVAQLAWDRALAAVKAGTDPATLEDFDRLAELLAEASRRAK